MDENAPRYSMAFSTHSLDAKIESGSPFWKTFNASFENDAYPLPLIALLIDEGRAFTTQHANNWRTSANYICGQHLGVDFDTRSAADVLADPFVQTYGALVYATPSSTPAAPRCRALFLLDTPIVQAANYVRAAMALIWLFGGTADRQCKDAARFFYGALGSMPVIPGNVLPLAVVRELIGKQDAATRPAPHSEYRPSADDGPALAGTLRFAADAPDGQRNTSLYWAARRWAERAVPRADAETMAQQVGRKNGLSDAETAATVRSAYRGA